MAARRSGGDGFTELSAGDRKLAHTLRRRIAESVLPGETAPSDEQLDEAASLLIEAARQRDGDKAAMLVRSAAGARRATRVALVNRDKPFLVDSIAATVAA